MNGRVDSKAFGSKLSEIKSLPLKKPNLTLVGIPERMKMY